MKRACSNAGCFVDDGEVCSLGWREVRECPSWSQGVAAPDVEAPSPACASSRVPWSGSALGLGDLGNLVPRGRSILVGVLGAHDAGKTTLLTGNYLHLLRGRPLAGARFAGSHTLGAWEALAAWVRFDDAARRPTFPPHTPRGTARVPGLLHVALRGAEDQLRDVLLTDAPGEWFTRWAVQESAPDAEGARWVVRNADAFVVVADCQRLSGPQRGGARNDLRQLLERLGNHVGDRPTALVWAKSDHAVGAGIRAAIRVSLSGQIPHAVEVESTTERPESLVHPIEVVVRAAWTPPNVRRVIEPVLGSEPFAVYRGHHAVS